MDQDLTTLLEIAKKIEIRKENSLLSEEELSFEQELIDIIVRVYAVEKNLSPESVNIEDAYTWLNRKYCVNLLNELLENELSHLSKINKIDERHYDYQTLFTYTNLLPLMNIMKEEIVTITNTVRTLAKTHQKKVPYQKLTEEQIESYIIAILNEIDKSLTLSTKFLEAKKNNFFIDLQPGDEKKKKALHEYFELSNLDYGWHYINTKKHEAIITEKTNTIKDVSSYLHEFAHYLIKDKYQSNITNNLLVEYPPLTFELFALDYLHKIGYNEDELINLYSRRAFNTLECSRNSQGIFTMLINYQQGNKIQIEAITKELSEVQKLIDNQLSAEQKRILLEKDPDYFDNLKRTCEFINNYIDELIDKENGFSNCYPYVVGQFLAEQTVNKLNNTKDINDKFLKWTQNITIINPYDIIKDLDLDITKFINPEEIISNYQKENIKKKITKKY